MAGPILDPLCQHSVWAGPPGGGGLLAALGSLSAADRGCQEITGPGLALPALMRFGASPNAAIETHGMERQPFKGISWAGGLPAVRCRRGGYEIADPRHRFRMIQM